jgi:phospholipid/cholesterol/gamma-HCH transport system substrate-binding protein
MKRSYLEFIVGLFLAIGVACLAYLSIQVARQDFFNAGGYEVRALFSNCSGLRPGSQVMIAGVEVGRVKCIGLEEYEASVAMTIKPGVILQKDAIASVKSKGLIGEKFVEITPGAADETIAAGGVIRDTEPSMDIEGLLSKYVHGNLANSGNGARSSN